MRCVWFHVNIYPHIFSFFCWRSSCQKHILVFSIDILLVGILVFHSEIEPSCSGNTCLWLHILDFPIRFGIFICHMKCYMDHFCLTSVQPSAATRQIVSHIRTYGNTLICLQAFHFWPIMHNICHFYLTHIWNLSLRFVCVCVCVCVCHSDVNKTKREYQ